MKQFLEKYASPFAQVVNVVYKNEQMDLSGVQYHSFEKL